MLYGIDVSNNQGAIDWDAVAASGRVQFAFLKATEGVNFVDAYYLDNYEACVRLGIPTGTYHFARAEWNNARDEARFFIEQMGGATFGPGDMLALDIETPDYALDLYQWTLEWLSRVADGCGIAPVVYSNNYFLRYHNIAGHDDVAQNGLWLASWQDTLPPPTPTWAVVAFWQYSDKGMIPGIRGPVDLDVFNGTAEEMAAYGRAA